MLWDDGVHVCAISAVRQLDITEANATAAVVE